MSSKFVRDDDGTIRIVFTSQEAHVVINLTAQLLELLGEGSLNADIEADPLFQMMGLGASEQPPEDPVLRRLLPRLALAVRLGISKEFDERDQKTQKVPTGPGDADSNEKADLHKKYELMTDSDPMKAVYAVYSWLGWLQQSLLEVLMGSGDDHQAT
ncbi:MAG: DUF2017 family protein [Actinobacteria bacterium]|nr:DUF2017 family protein [Actinomycetota bacterium]